MQYYNVCYSVVVVVHMRIKIYNNSERRLVCLVCVFRNGSLYRGFAGGEYNRWTGGLDYWTGLKYNSSVLHPIENGCSLTYLCNLLHSLIKPELYESILLGTGQRVHAYLMTL